MTEPRPRRARLRFFLLLGVLAILPAACAVMAMGAAWGHNPDEEFHSAAGVQWGRWLTIGFVWFFTLWLPLVMAAVVVRVVKARRLRMLISRSPNAP